ncbi:hypothetical protein O6H91_Y212400 [Diphasiastrum complanatum]|nr:hypothetical protein O6H91_Y212400 [Diphasiastrum complanatum]
MVSLVEFYGQKKQRGFGLRAQPSKVLAISVMYGLRSLEASLSGQAPIQDATAPPTVHPNRYKMAPRSIAFKLRRSRRRPSGGGDEDGFDEDDGSGFYGSSNGGGWGSGSGSGGENGRGGWDFWGENSDEEWRWKQQRYSEVGDKTLGILYQVACWISLTHCFHYAVKRIVNLFQNGCINDSSSSGDPATFARCSSVFLQREVCLPPSENLQLSVNRR